MPQFNHDQNRYRIFHTVQATPSDGEHVSLPGFLQTSSETTTKRQRGDSDNDDVDDETDSKLQKTGDHQAVRKLTKQEKKARTGQNKGRKFRTLKDEIQVCFMVAKGQPCPFGQDCKHSHDLESYFKTKPKDIKAVVSSQALEETAPFVKLESTTTTGTAPEEPSAPGEPEKSEPISATQALANTLDTTTTCYLFSIYGFCEHGWKCRFLGSHVKPLLTDNVADHSDTSSSLYPHQIACGYKLVIDEAKRTAHEHSSEKYEELNVVSAQDLKDIRSFTYPKTIPYLAENDPSAIDKLPGAAKKAWNKIKQERKPNTKLPVEPTPRPATLNANEMDEEEMANEAPSVQIPIQPPATTTTNNHIIDDEEEAMNAANEQADTTDVPLRPVEKRRLDWRGKTYLAPLTTVGNLPFRQLCVSYGADITCGEMAMGNSLISAAKQEWSLLRRHRSERTFGIQLCGGKPGFMIPAAELVKEYCDGKDGTGIDFVDINLGCPIDLVFQKGGGSARASFLSSFSLL